MKRTGKAMLKLLPQKTIQSIVLKSSAFLFLMLFAFISNAQVNTAQKPGRLVGVIRDENNQPISGVTITAEKLKKATSTSVTGDYYLSLPPGTYTIIISYIGFETKQITDVVIKANEQTDLSSTLKRGNAKQLTGVVVTSSARRESTRGLLQAQKNAASMTDGISSEQILKTPDVNTAQVLKRVSGVTVQADKFVTIRGVSDRYNNVLINGSSLPSTEPNRRNFSFDIVPSALVDNVVVNKTATPDLSGEFTGGIVQINTKDIPVKNFLDVAVGTGFNTESINRDFISFERDKKAGIGKINEERLWYGDGRAFEQQNYLNALKENNTAELNRVAAQIPNRWQLYRNGYTPVQNYQISGGRAKRFEKSSSSFGVIGALTYFNEQLYEEGEARSVQVYDSKSKRSKYNTTIGGILNAGYKTTRNKFAWKNLYNKRYSNQFDEKQGYNINFSSEELRQSDVTIQSKMFQSRLEGEHLITNRNIKLDWYGDYVQLDREQPDSRFLLSTTPLGYNYNWRDRNVNYGGVFGSVLNEKRNNLGVNLSFPFLLDKEKQLFKMGFAYSNRKGDFEATTLRVIADDLTKIDNVGYIPYYDIVTQENFQNGSLQYIPTYANAESTGDRYSGTQKLAAFYAMIDMKFFKSLRVTGGIRNEDNKMNVNTVFYEPDSLTLKVLNFTREYREKDWLPSVNLIYSINSKMNVRAAFSKTIARPDFIERSPYTYFDFPEQVAVVGSGALEITRINNYDLRFEYYPSGAEIFSFSLFSKDFDKPVERFFNIGNPSNSVEYKNLFSATAKGFEIDVRKSLAFIAPSSAIWKNFFVSSNFTYLKGKIKYLVTKSPTTNQDTIPYISGADRPIQGLSPYIFNLGLSYQETKWGVNLAFNRSGRKIVNGGTNGPLIQYENPRSVLDLQLNAKLLKQRLELRFNIGDILNQDFIIYSNNLNKDPNGSYPPEGPNADPDGEKFNPDYDFVNYKVKKGTNFVFNVVYKF